MRNRPDALNVASISKRNIVLNGGQIAYVRAILMTDRGIFIRAKMTEQ